MCPSHRSAPTVGSVSLYDAKRAVRQRVLHARDRLEPFTRSERAEAIIERLAADPSYVRAQTVLLTLAFGSEWDTRALIELAFASQKRVALPRVNAMERMLDLHLISSVEHDVAIGFNRIREPRPDLATVSAAEIDWVLVPGVAFDVGGGRIGYGGGFYDRLLPALRPDVPRVAGAFEVQIVPSVPAAPHDIRIDLLATERRTIITGARSWLPP